MLIIRLARGGAKKKPHYSMVVTDSRKARNSGAIKENVGRFNPVARGNEAMIHMDTERIDHWIKLGAQTSPKVAQLIKIFVAAQKKGEKAVMRSKAKPTIVEKAATAEAAPEAKAEKAPAKAATAEAAPEAKAEKTPAKAAPKAKTEEKTEDK